MSKCILCGSDLLIDQEKISTSSLTSVYKGITKGYQLDSEFKDLKEIVLKRCKSCDFLFFDPICTGSEAFYEFLQKYDWYYQRDKKEFEIAREYISSKDSVLEVGAGSGFFASKLICDKYTGLEFNEKAITEAAGKGIKLKKQTIQSYSAENIDKHDVVCAFQVLEHVSAPGEFINSCIKTLKKGGKLIIAIPSADSYAAEFPNHSLNLPPHHVSLWTDLNLRKIAELNNLKLVNIYHEECDSSQLRLFIYSILCKKFYNSGKLVVTGAFNKLFMKVLFKISGIFTPKNVGSFVARGQSVIAIYEK